MWILDAANKKKSRGSGRGQFAQRVADEIVGVMEGKSGAWDRRGGVHKLVSSHLHPSRAWQQRELTLQTLGGRSTRESFLWAATTAEVNSTRICNIM